MKNSKLFLGLDVGSVSLKVVVMDGEGAILYSSYVKHHSMPINCLYRELGKLKNESSYKNFASAAVTGSGRELIANLLSITSVNEIVAQALSINRINPNIRTVIEIGGQDSKFIRLAGTKEGKAPKLLTQKMNDICAAGTGAFIEQQAERLRLPLDEFCNAAATSNEPAFIAGRCAVFAKSDIVHLRQEGVAIGDIAAGICSAIVRNYGAQFVKGKALDKPIAFQGGVAANKGVIKAFQRHFGLKDEELIIPEHFKVTGAMGAAIDSMNCKESDCAVELDRLLKALEGSMENSIKKSSSLPSLHTLQGDLNKIPGLAAGKLAAAQDIFIGIDVGSTSTCIALLNENKELLARDYNFNKSNLIESVNAALERAEKALKTVNSDYKIKGVGVTGSGRLLVSHYISADVVKDEISAQAKAAVYLLPEVDTIFEIGGEDSKYIKVSRGQVVDFEMNRVCAAGTGYFLQEQAERLGEDINSFSSLALKSSHPADLGSRCTVFMESDLVNYQQQGIPKEDLVAGLSYSIARNYLEKVAAGKVLGEKILFLGGVAFNDSVTAAFQQLTGKSLFVPEHHDISAAIGMALYSIEEYKRDPKKKSTFRGFDRYRSDYKLSYFECDSCTNGCRISKVEEEDETFHYGGNCSKYESKEFKQHVLEDNLFKEREQLLLSYMKGANKGREKIGIPRAHLFFELFPKYAVFLEELGFEIVLSDSTDSEVMAQGLEKTHIDNCFSCKIVYGHVESLLKKGVKKLFFPSIIELERRIKDVERNHSCPHVQAMPKLIQTAFPQLEVIIPNFYRERSEADWKKELYRIGLKLGRKTAEVKEAVFKAEMAQREFRERCESLGKRFLNQMPEDSIACVILGKIYNTCDKGLNLDIPGKLNSFGVYAVPYDCLPLSTVEIPPNFHDMIWASGQDVIRASRTILEDKRLYPVMITSFGCGPDSYITKFNENLFVDKPCLTLEVDEHTSAVGIITRIEAFLSNIRRDCESRFQDVLANFKAATVSDFTKNFDKLLYMPIGFDSYKAISAAFQSVGIRTKFLPDHDEKTERLGHIYSSGRECLPYIMHVGDVVRMTEDPEFDPDNSALYFPASDLACRVSLFSVSINFVLEKLGLNNFPIIAPRVSMDKDEMLGVFGMKFATNLFKAMVTIELLSKIRASIRPYEIKEGETDRIYEKSVSIVHDTISSNGNFYKALLSIVEDFDNVEQDRSVKRPCIGLVGDDYTRGNPYANNEIIREIEAMGGEVCTVPIWASFFEFQVGMKKIRTFRRGRFMEGVFDAIKEKVGKIDSDKIHNIFQSRLQYERDPNFKTMIELSRDFLDDRSEPLTIVALSHIIHLINNGVHGIVNLVGFQCMIHSIVSAQLRPVYAKYENLPNLTLSFDFQKRGHQKNRIEAFMYQVKQYFAEREGQLVSK